MFGLSRQGGRLLAPTQFALLLALSLLQSACLILEVDITSTVEPGGLVHLHIVVQENETDPNAWRGVQMVLVPDDWTFNSGTYSASDMIGAVGSGSLIEAANWADSAAAGVYPAPVGMQWIGLISDAAYSHGDTLMMETDVEFTAGTATGTFQVGVVVTKESFYHSHGDWFATDGSEIVGADSAMANYVTVASQQELTVLANVYLEGPFAAGAMHRDAGFTDHLPNAQPYSDNFYDGTALDHDNPDVVSELPDSVLDWVLVSLRSDVIGESEVVGSQRTAFLLESGSIVDTSGGPLLFPDVPPGPYYLVVRHRNHADVMSADTLDLSDALGSWDFRTSMAQAYSAAGDPMKDLGGGKYGMFACDANADGIVTAPDFNLWNAGTTSGATGYEAADCDMDGSVTASDFNLWSANTTAGAVSRVPEVSSPTAGWSSSSVAQVSEDGRAGTTVARGFALHPAYPNPFNPSTTITYDVPEAAEVRLVVFDALGRSVSDLGTRHSAPGTHSVTWDASTHPSGTYFVRIEAGAFTQTGKMILTK